MVYSIEELKQKIEPVARQYKLNAVWVFGSYARGQATDESDVDILVDPKGSGLKGARFGALFLDLRESIGKEIDMITENGKNADLKFAEILNNERLLVYVQQ